MSEKLQPQPENQEQPEREVIVDIGTGNNPAYQWSEKLLEKVEQGAKYICIDCEEEDVLKNPKVQGEDWVVGDIRKLPIKDKSADQIWLLNVFSDFKNLPDIKEDGTKSYNMGLTDVFEGLERTLKDNGRIVIGETYTPSRGAAGGLAEADFSDCGLEKKVYKGEELDKFFEDNKIPIEYARDYEEERPEHKQPYFMELTKKKEE
ncbi:class I SAM-dependent methyltransferase [Patescibacteria group bacterium]|nr:class I SAM-dependent methyltransferase [Patescibacteria group bacterium]